MLSLSTSLDYQMMQVDLSILELIEGLDDATWDKLEGRRRMKRLKLPPLLSVIRKQAFFRCGQLTHVTLPS
jgi:hypothetical protein